MKIVAKITQFKKGHDIFLKQKSKISMIRNQNFKNIEERTMMQSHLMKKSRLSQLILGNIKSRFARSKGAWLTL